MRDYPHQLKFVIAHPADVREVLDYLDAFSGVDRDRVLMMPEGTDPDRLRRIGAWLEPLCRTHQLVYGPRRQIEWFGARRGT
jgi:7-carboxy-7-deazaguanine synthase